MTDSQLLKHPASLKNQMMDKVQKKKIVSVNFSHSLFSLTSTHDNLGMQAWLGSAWPGSE